MNSLYQDSYQSGKRSDFLENQQARGKTIFEKKTVENLWIFFVVLSEKENRLSVPFLGLLCCKKLVVT